MLSRCSLSLASTHSSVLNKEMVPQEIQSHLEQMRLWDSQGVKPAADTDAYVKEILDRWAPMAEELGLSREQSELQNLAVKLGYPDDYKMLKKLLMESEMMCENVFRTFALPIRSMLDAIGLEYDFKYRMKSVYSIWRKMRVDNKTFDDVYDLFAARIVYKPQQPKPLPLCPANEIDTLPEAKPIIEQTLSEMDAEHFTCWRIYTIISMLYRIHPDRIKNWITHPKPSGYQALQLTVMGPDCNWVEIQIRSERMHYDAEEGIAAHWKYKKETATN